VVGGVFSKLATVESLMMMLPLLLGLHGAWRLLLFLIPLAVAVFGGIQWLRLKLRLEELESPRRRPLTQAKSA
jgi:hypothetical protein